MIRVLFTTIETVPFSSVITQFIDGVNNFLLIFRLRGLTVDIDTDAMNSLGNVKNWSLATQQVIMNLFDNAAKYSLQNTAVIVSGERRKGFVDVIFQTRSITIHDNEKDAIFERGYRAAETRKLVAGGTGLGLWISKRLMNAMGGELRCVPGKSGGRNKFIVSWSTADEKHTSVGRPAVERKLDRRVRAKKRS